jgi:tRNA-dihydrouridine synthase
MPLRALKKLNGTKLLLDKLGTKYHSGERVDIPVSVKTRLGYDQNELETWLPLLLSLQPANISLHGRTFKQHFSGNADWEQIAKAANIVAKHNSNLPLNAQTTIWGNGDVKDYEQAQEYAEKYQLDGILIGRAVLGDPWVMLPSAMRPMDLSAKIPMILDHTQMHEQLYPNGFCAMRKHLAWYFKGFPGVSEMRQELVQSNNTHEVENIISRYQLLTR